MNNKNIDKKIQIIYVICIMIAVLGTAFTIGLCYKWNIESLRPSYIKDVSADVMGMIIAGILIYSLAHDKPWDKQNRAFFRLVFVLGLLFHFDAVSAFMEGSSDNVDAIRFINTAVMIFEAFMAYCFWAYIREEMKVEKILVPITNVICKAVVIIDLIVCIINCKFNILFSINENGEYLTGKFAGLYEITKVIIYAVVLFVILEDKERSNKERGILLTFLIFPIISHMWVYLFDNYASIYPMYLFSVMLIYINVFATRSRKIAEQKAELDKQNQALMISQIQPHFIYNVLTTISNLCVKDPEEAEETTVLFSQYLRTNLDSLRKSEPVKFAAELGHINTYIALEKKRFKDKLNVEIDCPETGFLVPALGLQPIVENSIKHGIRGKDSPGFLKISSKKVNGGYEVVIEDDGVGFDMNAPIKDDGRSHVGMVNVKSRLEQICDATVTVVSSPGNGCKTTIFFPEK